MSEISKASCDCKVFGTYEEAEQYGQGAILYSWLDDENKTFPEGVRCLRIMMPVTCKEAWPDCMESMKDQYIDVGWHTNNFV
jgi:hypothetical protein